MLESLSRLLSLNFLLSDGKSWNLGKGKLGRAAWINFRKYFTQAIRKHAKPGILKAAEQEEAASALKRALMAVLYHNLNINDHERRTNFAHPKIGVGTRKVLRLGINLTMSMLVSKYCYFLFLSDILHVQC